jgi:hypothetical protein
MQAVLSEPLFLALFAGLGLLVAILALDHWFKPWSLAPRNRDALRRWGLR